MILKPNHKVTCRSAWMLVVLVPFTAFIVDTIFRSGVAGSCLNPYGGHDPIVMSMSQTWASQTLNQHMSAILLLQMQPYAGRGLIRCDRTLGTCDMYCDDMASKDEVLWLLTSLDHSSEDFWSSKVMSHQMRCIHKVPFKKVRHHSPWTTEEGMMQYLCEGI